MSRRSRRRAQRRLAAARRRAGPRPPLNLWLLLALALLAVLFVLSRVLRATGGGR